MSVGQNPPIPKGVPKGTKDAFEITFTDGEKRWIVAANWERNQRFGPILPSFDIPGWDVCATISGEYIACVGLYDPREDRDR